MSADVAAWPPPVQELLDELAGIAPDLAEATDLADRLHARRREIYIRLRRCEVPPAQIAAAASTPTHPVTEASVRTALYKETQRRTSALTKDP